MRLPCEPLCQFSERLFFTTFPHPPPPQERLNRNSDSPPPPRSRPNRGPPASPDEESTIKHYWFTIDNNLTYLSFFEDWGPLNLAMVFKACILIHELLEDKEMSDYKLVLYSSNDPRRKANAALLLALYVMIVQRRAPWEAFHPIAELEFMPFRDAGRGRSDFNLSIQDCLWGVWKAMQNGLCDMNQFSVEDYEYYEKVENGDWNWITPNFIAFASPVDPSFSRKRVAAAAVNGTTPIPKQLPPTQSETALQRKLPAPFLNCLEYFQAKGVKLVVRLNNPLYDKVVFEEHGVDHLELYFDDGTNPSDEIVRKFIQVSDAVIESGGVVAVHCKAGLGRTGTLIGAYLIWKYGFTANEAIAFMRIVRPGSVVGPQQQYMYLKQLEWSKWAAVDELRRTMAAEAAAAVPIHRPATPPSDGAETKLPPVTPSRHVASSTAAARAMAPPGQPRKTPTSKRILMIQESEEDDDEDELELKSPSKPSKPTRVRPATLTRPASAAALNSTTRTTRSATNAAAAGRTGGGGGGANTGSRKGVAASASKTTAPYRVPRQVGGTTRTTRATANNSASLAPTTPSRLPTLIPSKRSYMLAETGGVMTTGSNKTIKLPPSSSSDAWMTGTEATAVVVPGTKSDRPLLRSVRRRRSSFSSADIVA